MASKRITDFKPHKANANKGSERGEYMIEASLREVGAWRSVGADRNGTIGVGNKTTQKWQEIANPDDVIVVHTTGDKLVVVQRDDLDFDSDDPAVVERTVKAAYYDNRAGEVSMTWDAEQVMADLSAGLDLSAMFKQDELDKLLADLQPKATEGDTPAEPDRAEAEKLAEQYGVRSRQVWQLGRHRIAAIDSLDAVAVGDLLGGAVPTFIWSDPPYGADVVSDGGTVGGGKSCSGWALRKGNRRRNNRHGKGVCGEMSSGVA